MPLPRLLGSLLSCRLLGQLPAFSRSPLEKEMATHSRNLAWKNPTDRGAWRATVRGAARVRHDLATKPSQGPVQSWACPSVCSMLINSALVSMRAQVRSSKNDFLSNSWVFAAQHGNWETWRVDMCIWETLLDPILFYFIVFGPAAWLAGSEFVNQALTLAPCSGSPEFQALELQGSCIPWVLLNVFIDCCYHCPEFRSFGPQLILLTNQ